MAEGEGKPDPEEVARFEALALQWWDPEGSFKPLHAINPLRMEVIRDRLVTHFHDGDGGRKPLEGRSCLDIGCGGGLVTEPLSRLGGRVLGVDPGRGNIHAARKHAASGGLDIAYRVGDAQMLLAEKQFFDLVLALEVVEHVPDRRAFVTCCASLVAPGGLLIISTINRTASAYALAIIGAERVLRWLPVGTHRFDKLVRPDELEGDLSGVGFSVIDCEGIGYNPFLAQWRRVGHQRVNYFLSACRADERTKEAH